MKIILRLLGSNQNENWYIFILQSDLIFQNKSSIRDHFRGWRKVLLYNIAKLAKGKANNIFLCTSNDIFNCCHKGFMRPDKLPDIWVTIYDGTAKFFNMDFIKIKKRINIQIFSKQKPIYTNCFYKLRLN